MTFVPITYYTVFGAGDGSENINWEVLLTEEESRAYERAKKLLLPLKEVEDLKDALIRAYDEIEKEEIDNAISYDEEFVTECMGTTEMDAEDLNDLVKEKDSRAIEFFGLEDLSDEELQNWDANKLEQLPTIAEFDTTFEAQSPFAVGWELVVNFKEDEDGYDDVEEEDAKEVIEELFIESKGDYKELREYLKRLDEYLYSDKSAFELAQEVAEKLSIKDFEE